MRQLSMTTKQSSKHLKDECVMKKQLVIESLLNHYLILIPRRYGVCVATERISTVCIGT